MKKAFILLCIASSLLSLSACAPVEPWQKEHLAVSHMAFDTDPLESRFKQHVYNSKEGSSGGYGVGGGGCGCN